jgi:hypothetical protein
MTPAELMVIFPKLDFMMAETLLKLDERGILESRLETDFPHDATPRVIVGAITVDDKNKPC